MTLVFGCGLAIINGFYAQRRAYFTLGIDSPHHGLSNELLYVAIGHFKVILSQTGVCLGPLTTEAAKGKGRADGS